MDARGATADQIWDAITKPEFTSKYFYGSLVETTGETGAPICYYSPDRSERWTDEVVIDSERPHRLVMGWRSLYDPELAAEERSRVTWEIEEQPGGVCKLTVIHDQLEGAPKTGASVSGGWMFIISGLKTWSRPANRSALDLQSARPLGRGSARRRGSAIAAGRGPSGRAAAARGRRARPSLFVAAATETWPSAPTPSRF